MNYILQIGTFEFHRSLEFTEIKRPTDQISADELLHSGRYSECDK